MNIELVKKTEQDKVIELMCQILELGESSEKVVIEIVKEKGINEFFDKVEDLNISELEKERIYALKDVIETKEQEIANMEGVV